MSLIFWFFWLQVCTALALLVASVLLPIWLLC
nr:MAG TPA: cytochrome c oxidase subunit [Caudoviricetes sp.]DAS07723.1 MAG TPA: cytochrome c oxidase subunit [Caudoviricetes sp.]